MYQGQTLSGRIVQPVDSVAAETGRILVVDDDRSFGGFMLAALENRGHDVDWAGCMSDALASLYGRRYDLIIIDLRLPDGSGLDLLRDATDAGLLVDSSAIILTGHEFEQPDDIQVYRKPLDLDPFLDRMGRIISLTKRRRAGNGASSATGRAPAASQAHGQPRRLRKIELVLYTSAWSEKCQKAVRTISGVLEQYEASQVSFRICDLSGRPDGGDADGVIFTPTLVKRGPGPRTWIVGNLDQPELLIDLLDVSGVERRR